MALPTIEFRDAYISADEKYRYWLERRWSGAAYDSPMIVWCMLNPSTADASVDDPTIRRCVGFTNALGFGRLMVVNLYAYRSKNPRVLRALDAAERFGPENFYWLDNWIRAPSAYIFVCAWGRNRMQELPSLITESMRYALGFTKTGEPSHPLYLPADSQLMCVP